MEIFLLDYTNYLITTSLHMKPDNKVTVKVQSMLIIKVCM